ncbi:hypothetical protein G6F57_012420 [Rhizopus arrhizus]|uniref:Uncharacterized protein n=1 Tax=Rhizopus oryzae TaxID=64495 RepID=A0A9P7BMJ1_RHIOR|nr:hypothetical protein G6F23_013154 [Rhizopus arrhizus]KAG0762742.1 hypothetical protein G6F24_006570 [Rhizopus arrhizus]KAG0781279.1 hypothetical protein G6F21_011725 [Rhizopus arrhizus]KAG0805844.1 hypothetical protein G6F20_011587 [Rhizopus arrhizus]KAG0848459.1 hypothetical protein G6F17_011632 [Rhizopus arrhizus]
MLNEVCKAPYSSAAYLHFESMESASLFYQNYVDKGIIINGVPFTVHGAKFRDGESVIYDHKNLNFGKGAVNACVVPVSATTVPMPVSATTVPMPVSATTVPMPVSTDANAIALPESTDANATTLPVSTNTNISTVLLCLYW